MDNKVRQIYDNSLYIPTYIGTYVHVLCNQFCHNGVGGLIHVCFNRFEDKPITFQSLKFELIG